MSFEENIKKIIEKSGLSRDEIKRDIQKEIDNLSGLIDEEAAILIVAKKMGLDLKEHQKNANMDADTPIKQLKSGNSYSIIGRIIEISPTRQYNRKDGGLGSMFSFILQDTTDSVRCVAWDQHIQITQEQGFAKNEIIRVVNGMVKPGRGGGIEMQIGSKSKIQIQPDQIDAKLIPTITTQLENKITPLKELSLTPTKINIEGRVINIFPPKEFESKTGKKGLRASLNISDDTAATNVVFWNDDAKKINGVQLGQKISITSLIAKQSFFDKSKIDLTASSSTEIKIISQDQFKQPILKISDLNESIEFGIIEGKVLDIEEVKNVPLKDGSSKELLGFLIADETSSIRVNLWGDQIIKDLKVNDVLRIDNCRVKLNKYSNKLELSILRGGKIEKIQKEISPVEVNINKEEKKPTNDSVDFNAIEQKKISEIKDNSYYLFKGTLTKEIKQISLYQACSKCMKKEANCQCSPKGSIIDRMILNLIIEDESNSIRVSLIGDIAEKFLGISATDIKKQSESGDLTRILTQINSRLIGQEFLIKGKGQYSSFNDSYEIKAIQIDKVNFQMEAQKLISEIESVEKSA